ncbi:hypothetical protein Afil01_28410 [Actinorhabdospora filicis]|uniref:M23ase beta-sheet core domain-containing protein n=1 Tax=Actinorhabdospora filicis TaxID=1785913 RepID=A0A9W6W8Y4_9ACTN|nr:M23 family metallopeptidase [Actinorhabdospora filicis]GLZ78034.1 hypothetical protein Afil01_28410 [Actinorhabdospora filicis]
MPGYPKRTAAHLSRLTPLLRKHLAGLRDLTGRALRETVPAASRRLPSFRGALDVAMPRVGLAAVLVAGILAMVFLANFAGTITGATPSNAAAAIGQRETQDQATRGQERQAPVEKKRPEKPVPAKSGWAAPSTADISDTYGPRGWRDGEMHWGMDFAANMGDKIYAAHDGTVVMAQRYGGYGNCVVIKHADGVQTLYGHFSALDVEAGDEVKVGDLIGRAGSTGDSTGPHLHFEVTIDGGYLDPQKFLEDEGVEF